MATAVSIALAGVALPKCLEPLHANRAGFHNAGLWLAEHARLLDELEQVGRWLGLATQSPDFPDRGTAELVAMTLQDLKDARALWHGSMTSERREEILRAVFNEP